MEGLRLCFHFSGRIRERTNRERCCGSSHRQNHLSPYHGHFHPSTCQVCTVKDSFPSVLSHSSWYWDSFFLFQGSESHRRRIRPGEVGWNPFNSHSMRGLPEWGVPTWDTDQLRPRVSETGEVSRPRQPFSRDTSVDFWSHIWRPV